MLTLAEVKTKIRTTEVLDDFIVPEGIYAVYEPTFRSQQYVQKPIWPQKIYEVLVDIPDVSPVYLFRCAYNVKRVVPWYADSEESALESFIQRNYSDPDYKGFFLVECLVEGEYYLIIETGQDICYADERI